jgi:hypothetical protein
MWYWRRIEKISWTDDVKNGVLYGVVEEKNFACNISKEG